MEVEIEKVELQYKELLEQLKNKTETNTNTLMNSNNPRNYKAYHYHQIKNWFFQMLQKLQTPHATKDIITMIKRAIDDS